MSELKVKKIKKVVKTENTNAESIISITDKFYVDSETFNKMISPNGIDVEPKNLAQFPKSDGEVLPKVVKKVKKIAKSTDNAVADETMISEVVEDDVNQQIYYVHRCGYDYIIDTINADVVFSGTKNECDDWMKEHSIVEGLCDYSNDEISDDELFAMLDSSSENVADENVTADVEESNGGNEVEKVDLSKQIVFTKVTDLDPKLYEDFTEEKYPYGAIFFDWEVYKYDWCVTFIDVIKNKKTVIVNDRKGLLKFYVENKGKLYFAYNNRNYDNFIYKGILLGMNPKEINDKIIYDGLKGFQISDKFKDIELYAFDCYRLGHSLKQYESFLQLEINEDHTPFDIDRLITEEEWTEILKYNSHDVTSCIEVFRKSPYTYEAHIGLIEMFKYLPFSAINKTSAQIVADVLKLSKGHDDSDQWDIPLPPNLEVKRYRHIIDWFLDPKNHDLKAEGEFDIMGVKHKVGWGGIHSALPKVRIDGGNIWHVDVQSYYPSELNFTKVYPENKTIGEIAFGKEGAKIYKDIYDLRLRLKHEGKKKEQAPLKICLNSIYGCLRDKNSKAYYPRCATLISVFGQMYLVDLMEHLEDAKCCSIIQNNTDGSIVKCYTDEDVKKMNEVCDDWERRTLMNLEREEISYIVEKDVNNYYLEFTNGKMEVKGSYLKETNDLDNDLPIINECMRAYIKNKVNVEQYINDCEELWKFMKTFKLSGNYDCCYHNGIKYNNKCYRVFASKNLKDTYLGKKKADNPTIEKFAGQSEHVFIENNDIRGKKCSEYPQLDKQWYIELVYKRLEDFGIDARPSMFDSMF